MRSTLASWVWAYVSDKQTGWLFGEPVWLREWWGDMKYVSNSPGDQLKRIHVSRPVWSRLFPGIKPPTGTTNTKPGTPHSGDPNCFGPLSQMRFAGGQASSWEQDDEVVKWVARTEGVIVALGVRTSPQVV